MNQNNIQAEYELYAEEGFKRMVLRYNQECFDVAFGENITKFINEFVSVIEEDLNKLKFDYLKYTEPAFCDI